MRKPALAAFVAALLQCAATDAKADEGGPTFTFGASTSFVYDINEPEGDLSLGDDGMHLIILRRSPATAMAGQISGYLQQASYPAALKQLHRQQAELYRQQNPPPAAGRCGR